MTRDPSQQPRKQCEDTIEFGDDFGDNETTFHCELLAEHKDQHQETGDMYGVPYTLRWGKSKK